MCWAKGREKELELSCRHRLNRAASAAGFSQEIRRLRAAWRGRCTSPISWRKLPLPWNWTSQNATVNEVNSSLSLRCISCSHAKSTDIKFDNRAEEKEEKFSFTYSQMRLSWSKCPSEICKIVVFLGIVLQKMDLIKSKMKNLIKIPEEMSTKIIYRICTAIVLQ